MSGQCKKPATEDLRKDLYMQCPQAAPATGATAATGPTGFENCNMCAMKEGDTVDKMWCARCKNGFMAMMGGCFGMTDG